MKWEIHKEAKHQSQWDTDSLAVKIQQGREKERECKRVKREKKVPGGPLDTVLRACDIWLDQCSSVRDSPLIHSSSGVNKHITYTQTHTHSKWATGVNSRLVHLGQLWVPPLEAAQLSACVAPGLCTGVLLGGRSFYACKHVNMFVLHKVQPKCAKLFQRFKMETFREDASLTWQKKLMIHKHSSSCADSVVAPSSVKLWKSSGPLSIPALTFLLGCPVFTGCQCEFVRSHPSLSTSIPLPKSLPTH